MTGCRHVDPSALIVVGSVWCCVFECSFLFDFKANRQSSLYSVSARVIIVPWVVCCVVCLLCCTPAAPFPCFACTACLPLYAVMQGAALSDPLLSQIYLATIPEPTFISLSPSSSHSPPSPSRPIIPSYPSHLPVLSSYLIFLAFTCNYFPPCTTYSISIASALFIPPTFAPFGIAPYVFLSGLLHSSPRCSPAILASISVESVLLVTGRRKYKINDHRSCSLADATPPSQVIG